MAKKTTKKNTNKLSGTGKWGAQLYKGTLDLLHKRSKSDGIDVRYLIEDIIKEFSKENDFPIKKLRNYGKKIDSSGPKVSHIDPDLKGVVMFAAFLDSRNPTNMLNHILTSFLKDENDRKK